MLRFALVVSLLFAVLAASAISWTFGRVALGLCVTTNGKGTTVLIPGKEC